MRVTIDGGSDSLMRGDESGLGDPIEDCVSVTASAALGAADGIRTKLLISIGFGMDRFNNVCDADGSMRNERILMTHGVSDRATINMTCQCSFPAKASYYTQSRNRNYPR